MRWSTILINYPWLALIAALLLAGLYLASRSRTVLVAALLWGAYAVWEYAVSESAPDANIRIDLLAIYPVLLAVTVAALWSGVRSSRK